eukprot:4786226-Heterocapsa_arctica.AAC.1
MHVARAPGVNANSRSRRHRTICAHGGRGSRDKHCREHPRWSKYGRRVNPRLESPSLGTGSSITRRRAHCSRGLRRSTFRNNTGPSLTRR